MKLSHDEIKKIVLFRALHLGDLLCAVPAFRALRYAFPKARIDLIGLPWSLSFVKRFHDYLDRLILFPGYPGLPEQTSDRSALLSFFNEMRAARYDLAIQMQGNGNIVNELIRAMGAKQIAGFYKKEKEALPDGLFMKYPGNLPELKRHLKLMSFLGIPEQGVFLEFPLYHQDYQDVNNLGLPLRKQQYIVVHPGSRSLFRRWHPQYFAALADYCVSRGLTVIITGTADEATVAKEVLKYMRFPAIDLTGTTTLGAVALLIKDALALISNCTGVSHIAAAMETPSLVISMDGEPGRWSPLNKELHHVIDWKTDPDFRKVFKQVEILLQDTRQMNLLKMAY